MADLFFDDSDEAEDEGEANVVTKPLPGFYQNLLGNLPPSKGSKPEARSDEVDREESDTPLSDQEAQYWSEEGYEEPSGGMQDKDEDESTASVDTNTRLVPRLCIAGTWLDWQITDMKYDARRGGYYYMVHLGNNAWESFQIMVDGDWHLCIHPDCVDACPHKPYKLCGPDHDGHGKNWTVGRHPLDKGYPGACYEIRVALTEEGTVSSVHWKPKDVGAAASRSPSVSSKASSRAPSSHEGVLPANEVEDLNEILGRVDSDMAADELPANYHARPVPKRAWNPDAGKFEVVSDTAIVASSSSSGRGWIPRKEATSSAPLPLEDIITKLDSEEQSPEKEPETRILAITNEAESAGKLLALSSKEMPTWSKDKDKLSGKVTEDLMERYENDQEVETPSLYSSTEENNIAQRVRRTMELRRRRHEKAIDEAIAEDPTMQEYLKPKAEGAGEQQNADLVRPNLGKLTQSGPTGYRTTVAQDQGDRQVNLRPTKQKMLPGMGRQKRTSEASSSSSQPAREVSVSTSSVSSPWSAFSLLPGMPLPFERAAGSSASRPITPAMARAAGPMRASSSVAGAAQASSSGSTANATKPASSRQTVEPRTLAEKLRSHRQQRQEDDDEAELHEAFQSIGGGSLGFQPKRVPGKSLPKSAARASAKGLVNRASPKFDEFVGALDSLDAD